MTWYTGCAFERDDEAGTIKIHQTAFIDSILDRFDISSTRSVPAHSNTVLRPREEEEQKGPPEYRSAVGCLMWAANMTRPDIANAVREVARHCQDPSKEHWKAVCYIFKFLQQTRTLGLIFEKGRGLDLEAYADSAYARGKHDGKSVTGSAVLCGGSLVSWISRTQRCVATSTTEAEYIAMADSVKDALFVRDVLGFLVPGREGNRIIVREDNEGAINLANNPLSSARSRHIDVRYHFLRQEVSNSSIVVLHTTTNKQRADVLTKPLAGSLFRQHRDFLMGISSES